MIVANGNYVWYTLLMKLRLDKLGRVVLPKPLRARYGLRPGTELEVNERAQEFALRPAQTALSLVNQGGVWVHHGVPHGDLDFDAVIREDREDRFKHLGGLE
jgi:AbrB family looped-hinge helix DNA binding protein